MAVELELVVKNERGLHLSSAAKIARVCQKFSSEIRLSKDNKVANAKSVLNITALLAPAGTKILVSADGPDEQDALDALQELFDDRFGEGR